MDLALTHDQSMLVEHVRGFFQRHATIEHVRAAEPLGFDGQLWQHVAAMGLPSIAVPAGLEGGGSDLVDLGLVAKEAGRSLAAVPLIEAAVTNNLLARVGATQLLREAINGTVMTLALEPTRGAVVRAVPAGAVAEVVVVLRGDDLLVVRDGCTRRKSPSNLASLPIADWDLASCESTVVASGPVAASAYSRALDEWRALCSAALVGLAQAGLELGVDYVKERRAFGVLIASFQAVQHRLADAATAIDGAELLASEALWALDGCHGDAPGLASMAFLFAAETAYTTCSESLQFHGGYGFTLEYDIQLYLRRAKGWPLVLGDPYAERRRLASLLFEQGT